LIPKNDHSTVFTCSAALRLSGSPALGIRFESVETKD
jgi:hypothetical protein